MSFVISKMAVINYCVFIATIIFAVGFVHGQLNPSLAYCFHFTWLGPRYTNESVYANATCSDAISNTDHVPCVEPLVVSYDGSRPDWRFIWEQHQQQASCPLTDSDVCVTYSYIFDGHYENTTHMCTKVTEIGGGAITDGCYEEDNGSRKTRLCICRSLPGHIPCNSGPTLRPVMMIFCAIALGYFGVYFKYK